MEKWERDLERSNALEDSFKNTCTMASTIEPLMRSVDSSRQNQQVVYGSEIIPGKLYEHKWGKVIVSPKKTLEAASAYKGKKTAVLNFGSARQPAGGNHQRSTTQEESLCRETTLYQCLDSTVPQRRFYEPHANLDYWYNNDLIYTPSVTVFKNWDTIPKALPESQWYTVDVITMAAPNLEWHPDKRQADETIAVFEQRFDRIVRIALQHDVEVLILGAFGCGAFCNDPGVVATGAARVLERYPNAFETVEFAIPAGRSKKNYRMFRLILDRYLNN